MARTSELPREEIGRARVWLVERGYDAADPDPLVDLLLIAEMAGTAKGTPKIWRYRSRDEYAGPGKLTGEDRFPDPDDTRYATKPQWRAISTIVPYLWRRGAWPPGGTARLVPPASPGGQYRLETRKSKTDRVA